MPLALVALQPGWCHCPPAECGGSLYTHQRSCLSYCPPRYYGRTRRATRVCASCHPSCYTCQGASANNCTACVPPCTLEEQTHSCSPPRGVPVEGGPQRDLFPLLVCGGLILAAGFYVTSRVAFCFVKGTSCCPRAGRTA